MTTPQEGLKRAVGDNSIAGSNASTPLQVDTIAALRLVVPTAILNGQQVNVVAYSVSGDGGGGLFYYNASSSAADDGGSVIAPTSGTGRWIRISNSGYNTISVKSFGAKSDGTTDDWNAINNAYLYLASNGGGVLSFPHGTTRFTKTIVITASNITISGDGSGTKLLFDPSSPYVSGINDRGFMIITPSTAWKESGAVSGSIAINATSFTTTGAPGNTIAGDWIILYEIDPGIGDVVIIDWVQVKTVVGTTVTTDYPARTAFSGVHSATQWANVGSPCQNISLHDFYIYTTNVSTSLPAINIAASRNVNLSRITSNPARGNAFYTYRASMLSLNQCNQIMANTQATEFAATVDLRLTGNGFGNDNAVTNTSSLVLDFGTAFFTVTGNTIGPSTNLGVQINYGVHDGTFIGNSMGEVRDGGIGQTVAIACLGTQRVAVIGNSIAGGTSPSFGVSFSNTSGFTSNITSTGNLGAFNQFNSIGTPYSTQAGDTAFDFGSGALILSNGSTSVPGTAASTGTTGMVKWDAGFIYLCTATNTWKRTAISTW